MAGPMFIASTADLVIAQCKAGIVGSFPALNARPKEMLEEWLIRITTEGTWLEMTTLLNPYDVREAKATVWTCAQLLYPRHFGPEGPLGR